MSTNLDNLKPFEFVDPNKGDTQRVDAVIDFFTKKNEDIISDNYLDDMAHKELKENTAALKAQTAVSKDLAGAMKEHYNVQRQQWLDKQMIDDAKKIVLGVKVNSANELVKDIESRIDRAHLDDITKDIFFEMLGQANEEKQAEWGNTVTAHVKKARKNERSSTNLSLKDLKTFMNSSANPFK